MTVTTVGSLAQTNRTSYLLREYLSPKYLKSDDTIVTAAELKQERNRRGVLYVARQVAGLPTVFLAPTSYFFGCLGGAVVGTIGGFCKEKRWPANGTLKEQWTNWMQSTAILTSRVKKVEKATEATLAITNLVLACTFFNEAGVYSGFLNGASLAYSFGVWIAQKLEKNPEQERLLGTTEGVVYSV